MLLESSILLSVKIVYIFMKENTEVVYHQFTCVCVCCRKHIEVHGRPTPAVFRSSPDAGGRSSYQLLWTVDSYSPIQEYRLLYRQIQPYHKVRRRKRLFSFKKTAFFFENWAGKFN